MSGKRYPEEFKIEAVKQVVDRGHSVSSVATRLDITTHSLYAWIKKYGPDSSTHKQNRCSGRDPPSSERVEAGYGRTGHIKKPRRTSQSCPTEVRLYPRQQPLLACSFALSGSGCPSEWILFLASAATFAASPDRSDADRANQTVLA